MSTAELESDETSETPKREAVGAHRRVEAVLQKQAPGTNGKLVRVVATLVAAAVVATVILLLK